MTPPYQLNGYIEKSKHGLFRWLADKAKYVGEEAVDALKGAFNTGKYFLPELPELISGLDDDDTPLTLLDSTLPIRLQDMNYHLLGQGLASLGHTPDFGNGPVGPVQPGRQSVFMADLAKDEPSQNALLSGWLKFRSGLDGDTRNWRDFVPPPNIVKKNLVNNYQNTSAKFSQPIPTVAISNHPTIYPATPIETRTWEEAENPLANNLPSLLSHQAPSPTFPTSVPAQNLTPFSSYQTGYQTAMSRYQAPQNQLRDHLSQIQQLASQQETLKQLETLNKHLAQQTRQANWKRFEGYEKQKKQEQLLYTPVLNTYIQSLPRSKDNYIIVGNHAYAERNISEAIREEMTYLAKYGTYKPSRYPTNPNLPIEAYPDVTQYYDKVVNKIVRETINAFNEASHGRTDFQSRIEAYGKIHDLFRRKWPNGAPWDLQIGYGLPGQVVVRDPSTGQIEYDETGKAITKDQYAFYKGNIVRAGFLSNYPYGIASAAASLPKDYVLFLANPWGKDNPEDQAAIEKGYDEYRLFLD